MQGFRISYIFMVVYSIVWHLVISILDYFSVRSSKSFPNPGGLSLVEFLLLRLSRPIVRCIWCRTARKLELSKKKKPRVYSPQERIELGKLAGDIGASSAAKQFSRKLKYSVN